MDGAVCLDGDIGLAGMAIRAITGKPCAADCVRRAARPEHGVDTVVFWTWMAGSGIHRDPRAVGICRRDGDALLEQKPLGRNLVASLRGMDNVRGGAEFLGVAAE